jgi:glycosyltransferase involved in cell wall biosynthesis
VNGREGAVARVELAPPRRIAVGRGTAFVLAGHCYHPRERTVGVALRVGASLQPVTRMRLPRADLHDALPPGDPARPQAYRSGFVACARLGPVAAPVEVELALVLSLASGRRAEAPAGVVELSPALDPLPGAADARFPGGGAPVAICMATYNPPRELLRRQIETLREQTHRNWVCLVSDDCSSEEHLEGLRAEIAGDSRFALSPSPHRLGFYRNFERALSMAPAEAEFVALCDQDDAWHADKLERLLTQVGSAQLAYSDARVVSPAGELVHGSYWTERRNNWRNFGSLLLANSVTGASLLCRRELLDDALPFPPAVAEPFHDHWLASVALAVGDLTYVDAPLYDYVQHGIAVIGHSQANRPGGRLIPELVRQLRAARGPELYFYDWQQLRLFAEVIRLRCWERMTPAKRRTLRLLLSADSGPAGLAWLLGRRARRLVGRNETLNRELFYGFGLLARRAMSASALGLSRPTPLAADARVPPRRHPAVPPGSGRF